MNVMLLSVGGSPTPLVKAVKEKRPDKIVFFTSQDTRSLVFEKIVPELGYAPEHVLIVVEDPEDLGVCTFKLLSDVPRKLNDLGCADLTWPNIVGYTGGTKTMSAAVVWASSRFPCEYIYVGGEKSARTKDGLGVVQDGREKIVALQNPWNKVAYFEVHDAVELFNSGQFGNANAMMKKIVGKVGDPHSRRVLQNLQLVFEGFHAWDVFDHKKAQGLLKAHISFLTDLAPVEESLLPGIKRFAAAAAESLDALLGIKPGQLSNPIIWDLLSNATRRAELEQKYEDACARCYAAIEKAAKHCLRRDYAINNNGAQPEQIPDALRKEYVGRYMFEFPESDGSLTRKLRFGLAASYRLLDQLGHPIGKRFKVRQQEIMKHIEARNHSILGHGIESAGKQQFENLMADALYLLNEVEDDLVRFPSFE